MNCPVLLTLLMNSHVELQSFSDSHLQYWREFNAVDMNHSEDNSVSDDPNNLQPQPVKEQPVEEKTSIRYKTVVCPRKSSLPKPKCASVLPFSDDEWIAYNIEQVHEPTAAPI